MGIAYVFLPDEPLDPWSRHERGILMDSQVLRQVERLDGWRVYRVPEAQPLIVPLDGGAGPRRSPSSTGPCASPSTAPARFLLKVTHTPVLAPRRGEVREGADRFTELTVPAAGEYELRLDVTVGTVLDQLGF